MQVVNKDAPAPVPGQLTDTQQKASKRDAAIQAFLSPKSGQPAQSQSSPVSNPSKVTPEEMSAIKTPTDANMPAFEKAVEAAQTGQVQDNVEGSKEEATKEPAKPDPLSAQYAQLARKERALRAKAMELKHREDALTKAKEAPVEAAKPTGIDLDDFKKNPWKYIQEAGVSYDEITQQALNAPSAEQVQQQQVISRLEAKIAELEGKVTGTQKTFEDSQKTQYQQAVNQIKNEVSQLVASNPEFETVKATGSIPDVVSLIEKTFHEDGILLSVEEAAKQVEDYLVEEAMKLAKLSKIQNRLKPQATAQAETPKSQGQEQAKQQQPVTKTLSNTMGATRQLSARERALAAAQHGPSWREKI